MGKLMSENNKTSLNGKNNKTSFPISMGNEVRSELLWDERI